VQIGIGAKKKVLCQAPASPSKRRNREKAEAAAQENSNWEVVSSQSLTAAETTSFQSAAPLRK